VYTAKAMAGLIHDAQAGRLGRDDTVVFAYRDDLLPYIQPSRQGLKSER
jgi:1-aminocyclopropane-1-carboxylate deaminase/D-cysteine desulfhydrase-like pyridoxal-dependent ACC family enzyme